MALSREISVLFKKEFKLDFRKKSAIFGLLLYVGGVVFICFLSFYLKTSKVNSITWNALFWIVLLFVSFNAIAKSFLGESQNRNFYYYYVASPQAIILSKILYNVAMMILFCAVTLLFFQMTLQIDIGDPLIFWLNLGLGAIGFASSLTLIAGIAAKTGNGVLMSVLSIPVMFPLLLLLVKISNHALDGLARSIIWGDMLGVLAINLIVLAASYLLFPYLWRT